MSACARWLPPPASTPDFAEKFLGFMVREVIRHHEDIKAEYDESSSL